MMDVQGGGIGHDHELAISIEDGNSQILTEKDSLLSRFLVYIGAHEFYSPEMWKAAMTELVATTFLIFTLTTSIISTLNSHSPDPKLLIPLSVFILLFLFLLITIPLSGGFMSPTFTFIAALKRIITITRALIYVLAQCLGSILAFLIIKDTMSPDLAHRYSLGGCTVEGASVALVLEFSCTFLVLYVGGTGILDREMSERLGLPMVCVMIAGSSAVAVFVSMSITGRAGYSGVGLNPARCLGVALVKGGSLWDGHWVFWVGPFAACVVYYGFFTNLPKGGLVAGEGKVGILKLAKGCMWRIESERSTKLGRRDIEP